MKPKFYTTSEAAKILGYKTDSRIRQKLIAGDFPHKEKCQCGQAWLIPESDLNKNNKIIK